MNGQFNIVSLALPLVAAYLFISTCYYYRFKAHRLSGQKFAALVLSIAILLYAAALVAASALLPDNCVGSGTPRKCFLRDWSSLKRLATVAPEHFASPAALTPLFAPVLGVLGNFLVLMWESNDLALALTTGRTLRDRMRFAAIARYIAHCDDPRMETLYRATFLQKPLCLSLSSGKAYIGIPIVSLNPTADHSFLRILPIASGHRRETDKQLILTTRYTTIPPYKEKLDEQRVKVAMDPEHALDSIHVSVRDLPHLPGSERENAKIDLLDFGVIVSWEEIVSLTIFDEAIFVAFNLASEPSDASDSYKASNH